LRVAGIEKKTGQTLNSSGLAHGLSTAPLASRHRGAGDGAVDNPAHCLLDHKPEDDISFRSPVQDASVFTMLGRERTTYIGSVCAAGPKELAVRNQSEPDCGSGFKHFWGLKAAQDCKLPPGYW
jgi:hypothetical protein